MPCGALTSKDFRFQQRVWYLKTVPSVCTGCSTGCNIHVDYNEEGIWRVRPRFNEKVNGHWMCDKGRLLYKNTDRRVRLGQSLQGDGSRWRPLKPKEALTQMKSLIDAHPHPAFMLTGQYTNEEYQTLGNHFSKASFYHWINNEDSFDDFDGLLLRGDRNPNTSGLKNFFPDIHSFKQLEERIKDIPLLFVLGPENPDFYPDIKEKTQIFSQAEHLVWMSLVKNPFLEPKMNFFQIPMKSFFEKDGSYTNFKGLEQKVQKIQSLSLQAFSILDFIHFLKEDAVSGEKEHPYFKENQFLDRKEKIW